MSEKPIFQPNDAPAGGWGALHATAKALREESAILKGGKSLLSMNQPDGFDCPGCAWPDPKHTSSFEFCENGAKAVAWETTKKRVTREFFANWTVGELERQSDHWLEEQGRLTEPMRYDSSTDRYVPVSWDEAFALIGRELRALADPNEVEFYTSGRTSNEAAFLYQLFARLYGTNNFPDCSNMCHEPTSCEGTRTARETGRSGSTRSRSRNSSIGSAGRSASTRPAPKGTTWSTPSQPCSMIG